jgi:hypothetical protein
MVDLGCAEIHRPLVGSGACAGDRLVPTVNPARDAVRISRDTAM